MERKTGKYDIESPDCMPALSPEMKQAQTLEPIPAQSPEMKQAQKLEQMPAQSPERMQAFNIEKPVHSDDKTEIWFKSKVTE